MANKDETIMTQVTIWHKELFPFERNSVINGNTWPAGASEFISNAFEHNITTAAKAFSYRPHDCLFDWNFSTFAFSSHCKFRFDTVRQSGVIIIDPMGTINTQTLTETVTSPSSATI